MLVWFSPAPGPGPVSALGQYSQFHFSSPWVVDIPRRPDLRESPLCFSSSPSSSSSRLGDVYDYSRSSSSTCSGSRVRLAVGCCRLLCLEQEGRAGKHNNTTHHTRRCTTHSLLYTIPPPLPSFACCCCLYHLPNTARPSSGGQTSTRTDTKRWLTPRARLFTAVQHGTRAERRGGLCPWMSTECSQ